MSSITPKPGMTVEISMQGIEKSRLDAIEAAESMRKANEAERAEAEFMRKEGETGRITAEQERTMEEDARNLAESGRILAEESRVTAENLRSNGEQSRAEAEKGRSIAESGRANAEQQRVESEEMRENAEAARVTAEAARANAEALRQQTFVTNEANRQAAFDSAETQRASEWTEIKSDVESSVGSAVASASAATDAANTAAENANAAAEKSVRYDVAQTLSDAQKAQARGNIDAADAESVDALKRDVAAITPDDTVVNGKPWTSKKTVDSVCMPIEETGNPVQVYPVEGYPLGVKVSWEPVQAGEGNPSPENIRPITGRDSVTVERCGENLLNLKPFNKLTKNGITFEYIPDGGIHISGIATTDVDSPIFPVWHLPPGKYYWLDTDKEISPLFVVQRNGTNIWLSSKGTFEILAGDVTKYWYIFIYPGATIDKTVYPYIVPGTTATTTYTPYIGSTNTLTLPETVYGGTLDVESGVVTVEYGHIASYAGEPLPGEWISDMDVYAPDATPTTGAQVAYKLAEPRTIQLTPQQITALSGVNTIYTDADGVVVTGAEDPKHTITELKNAIISLGGNV